MYLEGIDGHANATFAGKKGRLVDEMNSTYVKENNDNETAVTKNEECIPLHSWHTENHPVCNNFHELRFEKDVRTTLGQGYRRISYKMDTFMGVKVALTTLKFNWGGSKTTKWAGKLAKYTERVKTDATVSTKLIVFSIMMCCLLKRYSGKEISLLMKVIILS